MVRDQLNVFMIMACFSPSLFQGRIPCATVKTKLRYTTDYPTDEDGKTFLAHLQSGIEMGGF